MLALAGVHPDSDGHLLQLLHCRQQYAQDTLLIEAALWLQDVVGPSRIQWKPLWPTQIGT